MTRTNYALFSLVILLLVICLFLYKNSWQRTQAFNERVGIVNRVTFLLERLKNIADNAVLYKAVTEGKSSAEVSNPSMEVDSIIATLHNIVLYEDQRQRIDSIGQLIGTHYFPMLSDSSSGIQSSPLDIGLLYGMVGRAKSYAAMRLSEHRDSFSRESQSMNTWVYMMLGLSILLFVIGLVSTFQQARSKRQLKRQHDLILSKASVGFALFDALPNSNGAFFKMTYSNNGAVVTDPSGEQRHVRFDNQYTNHGELNFKFKNALVSGSSEKAEVQILDSGLHYWLLVNISRVTENSIAIYYQDITPLKQYELKLDSKVLQLEKLNKDLEQFAQATSHDLKEPLRKIRLMADMIRQGHNPGSNEKYLENILRSSARGLSLVHQILDYSRVEFNEKDFSVVNLFTVIEEVKQELDVIIAERRAIVEVSALPEIRANHIQMVQLFSNLLNNALKFCNSNQAPVININHEIVSSSASAKLSPLYDYHLITVEDNGIGFDQIFADTIFIAFHRLNDSKDYPGFGLGLSLCKKIVLNHQGEIKCTSVPGKGSKFFIYLPKS
jgi:signal transduction histidine kinase